MASPITPLSRPSPTDASFSTPTSIAVPPSAPSIVSSRMTDIASEDDDDDYRPEGLATRQSSTRKTNDPDRPPSSMSRPSTKATPSRRGTPFSGTSGASAGWRTGGAFGGPGGSISNTSRPQSANSRTSRTHVPSLASQAFFRPMSSQRLQAQRNHRPLKFQQPHTRVDSHNEDGGKVRRHSLGSNATSQRDAVGHQDLSHEPLPTSRGTEYTEQYDRYTANASPTGNATTQSIGESERPLQRKPSDFRPKHLNTSKSQRDKSETLPSMEKSPKSFRANFLLPAKRDVPSQTSRQDQQWAHPTTKAPANIPSTVNKREHANSFLDCFSSNITSKPSEQTQSQVERMGVAKAGVNYQYFSGNIVFCWGGRLQNTRDRPINISTVILVILPSALFFIFS